MRANLDRFTPSLTRLLSPINLDHFIPSLQRGEGQGEVVGED